MLFIFLYGKLICNIYFLIEDQQLRLNNVLHAVIVCFTFLVAIKLPNEVYKALCILSLVAIFFFYYPLLTIEEVENADKREINLQFDHAIKLLL